MGRPRIPVEQKFFAGIGKKQPNGCILWTLSKDRDGYGVIRDAAIDGNRRANRVAYVIAYGDIPDGMCVMHACDNPECVNPSHLKAGTNYENAKDRDNKGRLARGTTQGLSVLSDCEVMEIRKLRADGVFLKDLAAKFGVSESSIWSVVKRKTWKHLP